MANPEHLEILKKGVYFWNDWKREQQPSDYPKYANFPYLIADLSQANLSNMNLGNIDFFRMDLRCVNLSGTNLVDSNFIDTHLEGADLSGANLDGADLKYAWFSGEAKSVSIGLADPAEFLDKTSNAKLDDASLRHTNLYRADFGGVSLRNADLTYANLSAANLCGADFSGATVGHTIFGQVTLGNVKGLETVKHIGPSSIGIDTISNSKGKIPEVFLRGAGLSDTFITYATSLTGEAVLYYSCFISYSSHDESFAQRLHADLQQKSVRCWFAPEDIKIGDKIRPVIDQSIRVHDKLLLVLSKNSVASQWVEQEVETALERERKQEEKVLFPVRLDEAVMDIESGWPALIRNTRHIGDFSRWKDQGAYQSAFERLLRDLKAEE